MCIDIIILFCSINVYKKYFFCTFDGIFYLQGGGSRSFDWMVKIAPWMMGPT